MTRLRKFWNRLRGNTNTPPPPSGPRLLPLNRFDCAHCSWSIPIEDDWRDQASAWEMYRLHVRTVHSALGDKP